MLGLQRQGQLGQDMRFKTYVSASPKPGNLYFAYDLEHLTKDGWLFNVTNVEDWVPQTPFTVETARDLPEINPEPMLHEAIKKQSLFKRLLFKALYKKAMGPSEKTAKTYEKYLGKFVAKNIRKTYPNFEEPHYTKGSNYVRAGLQIILYPDSGYYQKFSSPDPSKEIMFHHGLARYYYLSEKY